LGEDIQRDNQDQFVDQRGKGARICFVAPTAYSLLSGSNPSCVIGPAVHQVLLARELLLYGFDVTFITYDEGGLPFEQINGMKIIKTYSERSRINLLLKALRTWRAMTRANADIYFQQGGVAGAVSVFCRLKRRRFALGIGSDAHVSKTRRDFGIVDRFGTWVDIKLASVVVVQTEFQREMLRKNFGRDGLLIRNHIPLGVKGMPDKSTPAIVLWVGSMAEVKQPQLFLELAQAVPEGKFQMIGGYSLASNEERATYERIVADSKKISNFEVLGAIPFDKINDHFSRAAVLVNTSKFEGFPYAFLQAWMHHAPVVSLDADPDELICRNKLGFHSRSFGQLANDVRTLLSDEHLRQEMGMNGRRYVEKEHDIKSVVRQYVRVFNNMVGVSPVIGTR